MNEVCGLRFTWPFNGDGSDPRLFPQHDDESHIHDLVVIIDLGFWVDRREKIPVALKKFLKLACRRSDMRGIVGIFILKIDNLQESGVREVFRSSGKVENAQIPSGLKNEVDLQTMDLRDNL